MELRSSSRFFRITLMLVTFSAGLVEPAVKIVSPVQNQIFKNRNQSVLFNCTETSASSSGKFSWFRGSTEIDPVGRRDTLHWSSFELTNLSIQDEGEYKCTHDGAVFKSVIVRLAAIPKTKNIGDRSPVQAVIYTDPSLQCKAEGWPKPNITWWKGSKRVSEIDQGSQYVVREIGISSQDDSTTTVASELKIAGIEKEDKGTYSCVATNAVGTNKYDISVTVVPAPKFPYETTVTADKAQYTAVLGEDTLLSCLGEQVDEDPQTFLFWERNGTRLMPSDDHYNITHKYIDQTDGAVPKVRMYLTIFDVDYADEGNYTCVVRSSAVPRVSDSTTLEVKASDKGDMEVWMIVVLAVALSLLTVALVALIFVKCRQIRRKKRMAKLAQKYEREPHDNNFENDVFVSYSSKDYDWIQESLLPVFDQNNIKYIIHSRDFMPGKAFFENMADSVYHSRKVILVMSVNYLSSGFCKDEMRMALYRSAERDDNSLIVVRIDEKMKPNEIPKSLRHKTFIDFTSKEEMGTWRSRILEYVRSENRSWSVASDDSTDATDTSVSRVQLILDAVFKLKRKKKQGDSRELTDHCEA